MQTPGPQPGGEGGAGAGAGAGGSLGPGPGEEGEDLLQLGGVHLLFLMKPLLLLREEGEEGVADGECLSLFSILCVICWVKVRDTSKYRYVCVERGRGERERERREREREKYM